MLLRLISVISLIQFMLLMISGESISFSLYRGILVFMILFTVIYLAIFFLNVIRGNTQPEGSAAMDGGVSQNSQEN